jgi:hypothetical protein
VAHITVNDGLLTAIAEALLAGEKPSYDNALATDEHELDRVADGLGGWPGLVEAARGSGSRLCDALEALSDEQAATPVPARIVDGGEVVVDEPVPWAGLMGAQEHRHLVMHTEQLRALRE